MTQMEQSKKEQIGWIASCGRVVSYTRLSEVAAVKSLRRKENAIALIFVLWLVALLAMIAASSLLSVRMEVRSSAIQEDEVRAYYLARAGVAHAIHLLATDEMSYDSYNEQWALIDSVETGMADERGRYIVRVEDESGKLNVNMAAREELVNFFGDEELADAIIDWRDEDEVAATYGAEADWYLSAGLPYKPRNAPFETLHELLLVRGMTKEAFYNFTNFATSSTYDTAEQSSKSLCSYLTVYAAVPNVMPDGSPLINLNEASADEMKSALGDVLTDEEIEAILRYREGGQPRQGVQQQRPQQQPQSQQLPQAQQPPMSSPGGVVSPAPPSGAPFGAGAGQNIFPPANIPVQPSRGAISDQSGVQSPGGQSVTGAQNIGPSQSPGETTQSGERQQSAATANVFRSIADLFSIPGLSPDKARQIIDRVSIWSGRARYGVININTAPIEVLLSIPGMTQEVANDIVAFRQQHGAFGSLSQLLDLPSVDERSIRQFIDKVSIRTQTFKIISVGWMNSGARYVIECVVERLLQQSLSSDAEQSWGMLQQGALRRSSGVSQEGMQQGNVTFVVRYWRER